MFFKKYLFNIKVNLDEFTKKDSSLATMLGDKTISVREDGLISLNKRKGLETYEADLDESYPSTPHLDFIGEKPIVTPKYLERTKHSRLLKEIFSPNYTSRPLLTAPIRRTDKGKYQIIFSRTDKLIN